jgi:uncharacterized surface protein with fasciclin (FAS1) repeats
MRKLVLLVVACLLAVSLTPALAQTSGNIVQVADSNANLNTFMSAIVAAGLTDELSGPGPYTVFAPTDRAFRNLPTSTLEALNSDINALRDLLLYHTVAGAVDPATVSSLSSLQGGGLSLSTANGRTRVNGGASIVASLQASNGVIYLIDTVLTIQAPIVAEEPGAAAGAPEVSEDAAHVTGLNDQVVIVGPAHVYVDPVTHPGQIIPSGLGPTICQRVYITEILGDYAKLRDTYEGWILTSSFVYPTSNVGC